MNVRRPQARRHLANPSLRLHNSLVALTAVAVVSAAGLLASQPLPAPTSTGVLIAAVVAPAGVRVLQADDGLDDTDQAAADPSPSKPRKHARRGRQSLAIPYFSFARS